MVAKISDLGVARMLFATSSMTKGPGTLIYMPPEACESTKHTSEMSKYNVSIDIFSFGVVTIFTIGEQFPCNLLAPSYTDENGVLLGRGELERRREYMQFVNEKLQTRGQLREDQPLIQLIQRCLQNLPSKRPSIRTVLCLLEEARALHYSIGDEESEKEKKELARTLKTHPKNEVREYKPVVITLILLQNHAFPCSEVNHAS